MAIKKASLMKSAADCFDVELASHVRVSTIAIALTLLLPLSSNAAEYFVNDENSLRAAITTANANGDTAAIIRMTSNFTISGGAALPVPTMPLTIDTQGFVLSRDSTGGSFSANFPSGPMTFTGTFLGLSGTAPGNAVNFTATGNGTPTIINNGTWTGGNQTANGEGGRGINVSGVTLVNNGAVSGGLSQNFAAGNASSNSAGVAMTGNNNAIVNNGTITGGNSLGGSAGAGIVFGLGTIQSLVNSGTIRGGSDLNGGAGGGAAVKVRASTVSIVNTGTLEGGQGSAAIVSVAAGASSMTIINSGTINAGAGATNAISLGGATSTSTLELRAGSQITGNVVAGLGTNDVFRLGGSGNAAFDVSTLGNAAQYRNFDSFIKTGSSSWTLTGTSAATAPWTVEEGRLALNGTVNSPVTVSAMGTLGGNGRVIGDVTNSGTIAPGNSIGTFFINGNYISNGGTLEMEGQFARTGSTADRLIVSGNVTGTTIVRVVNTGGSGAGTGTGNTDGISIIQVGGTSSANAFTLAGGYAAVGPYRYQLHAFDPTTSAASEVNPLLGAVPFYDYRLQSVVDASGNPVAVPQMAAYRGLPSGAVRYAGSLLDSVHQRLGELRRRDVESNRNDSQRNETFFVRTQGTRSNVSGNRASGYGQDIWFTQAGGNLFGKDMDDGAKLRIGGAFSYGESKLNVDDSSAKVNLEGKTLAVTSTYQAAGGWYLDTVAQVTKYSVSIKTSERGQTGAPDGLGYALSLEGGYPFDLDDSLIVEPQAQISYQKIRFDGFKDVDGISVDLRDGESLRGRFGGRIQKTFSVNTTGAWSPYVEANLLHEFLGAGSIRASDVTFASDSLGTSLQLGAGLNAQIGAAKRIFFSVSYENGLSRAAADAWSANVGLRIDF